MTKKRPAPYDGTYIDGTSQDTFEASFSAVLAALSSDDLGECLYVECEMQKPSTRSG